MGGREGEGRGLERPPFCVGIGPPEGLIWHWGEPGDTAEKKHEAPDDKNAIFLYTRERYGLS